MSLSEDELFLLSYYRTSEISGALFFGRLARVLRPGPITQDLSKHFADEAQHAWYWTRCIGSLGAAPIKLSEAYQDQYLEAAGIPANLMEVLAITLVFERRVINQYAKHRAFAGLHAEVGATIDTIMEDERWHVQWVRDALVGMEARYDKEHIDATIARNREADRVVYAKTMQEYEERMSAIWKSHEAGPSPAKPKRLSS